MQIAILGATGRMGRALIRLIAESEDLELGAAATEAGDELVGWDAGACAGLGELGITITSDVARAIETAAVAIDFTVANAVAENLAACVEQRVPIVIGTTGLTDRDLSRLATAGESIPLVYGRNMSVGVNVLTELVRLAAETLTSEYDIEITEAHHRYKLDAPSGTALQLGEAAAAARGVSLEAAAVYDRHAISARRTEGSIGFQSIRAGNIAGDHSVLFAADEEIVQLSHRAVDRAVFARGALRAARWVVDQPPGVYGMPDVLGLAGR